MSDTYYFVSSIVLNQLPQILLQVLFLAFIVGLFVRFIRNLP